MAATPRKRPGVTNAETSKTIGKEDTKSRQKADTSLKSTQQAQETVSEHAEKPVLTSDGRPMAKITFAGSELIPTGQYANVNLGPVVATVWIDPLADEPLPEAERNGIIQASNQLAETVLRDILGVQRNIVLEALQDEATSTES